MATRGRQLSNPEFVQFTEDVDLSQLNMPPWGMVVKWNDIEVLVFEGPGGLFLTDITAVRDQIEIAPPWEYEPLGALWVWHFPAELAGRLAEVAATTISVGSWTLDNILPILLVIGGLLVYREVR